MRILLAEDSALFREGLCRLLSEGGHEVTSALEEATGVPAAVDADRPDLVILDVRLPPDLTDDGARSAVQLRETHPQLPIVLLSQHVETRHCVGLASSGGFGYLLRDRVLRVTDFLDALERVAAGGSALDPEVVKALVSPTRSDDPVAQLSEREREVLGLVAQGLSNSAIARSLVVAERTVETHMRAIFTKLRLTDTEDSHRRVLAVLAHLT
ncbi:MAG: LuxR C-terminal-related transcriptional regulator [Marmoricola sp.]